MAKNEGTIKVSVRAVPANGFHRIGKKFLRDEATVLDVTSEELKILEDEKMLVVEEAKPGQTSTEPTVKKTADELIAMINECKTIDEVKPFFKDEERITVIAAAKAKIAALRDAGKK